MCPKKLILLFCFSKPHTLHSQNANYVLQPQTTTMFHVFSSFALILESKRRDSTVASPSPSFCWASALHLLDLGWFHVFPSFSLCSLLQSAILGMHAVQQRPMVVGKEVVPRPMMYVALTYDHRLIDGREAVMFLRRIKDVVEDPRRLLLDL